MKTTVAAPTTDELLIMVGISPSACDAALHEFYAGQRFAVGNWRALQLSNPNRHLPTQTPLQALYGRAVDLAVEIQAKIDHEAESDPLPVLAMTGDGLFGENIQMF